MLQQSTKSQLIGTVMRLYTAIDQVFRLSGFDINCAIKQAYLQHVAGKVPLPPRIMTTTGVVVVRVTRRLTQPIFTPLLDYVIGMSPLADMVDKRKLQQLLFNKYLDEVIKFVYERAYVMDTSELVRDVLELLSPKAMRVTVVSLQNLLANSIGGIDTHCMLR